MRFSTIIKIAVAGALALAVALVAVVKSIDVNRYRDVLVQAAKAATGRDLDIRGKLSLKLSLTPALIAEDVTLSNVSWGSRPQMLTLRRLRIDIGLLPLLVREVRLGRLVLEGPDLILERNADGQANWDFGKSSAAAAAGAVGAAGTPTTFKIAQATIDHGRVTYRDAQNGRAETLLIDHLTLDADSLGAPVGLRTDGAWNDRHFEISGVLGPLSTAIGQGKPYPVKLKAVLPGVVATTNGTILFDHNAGPVLSLQASADATDLAEAGRLTGFALPPLGAARIVMNVIGPAHSPSFTNIDAAVGRRDSLALTAKGNIKTPLSGSGVDLLLFLEGENPGGLTRALDGLVQMSGPLKGSAHLTDVEGGWHLGDLKVQMGRSDLSGDATLRLKADRPAIEAHLSSGLVDLTDNTTQVTARPEPPRPRTDSGRLFSDEALPVKLLDLADADLSWKIDRLQDNGLAALQINTHLVLQNGHLTLTPVIQQLAGGKLSATMSFDASNGRPPTASLVFDADRVVLGDLLRGLSVTGNVHDARTSLHLSLQGNGASPRALMSRLNGDALMVSEKGVVEGVSSETSALELLRQAIPWNEQKTMKMQCLVSRFSIADGMAHSEALLLDTDLISLSGQGSINLANEVVDLTLVPKPKDSSLLSLALPLDIGGTLSHPSVTPNRGAIVKGVASLAGSLALGPLGALLPLATTGSDDNPCMTAIAQAKKPVPAAPAKPAPAKPQKKGGLKGEVNKALQDILGK